MTDNRTQLNECKEAARRLSGDEDEACWDETLRKVGKQKPEPEKPE